MRPHGPRAKHTHVLTLFTRVAIAVITLCAPLPALPALAQPVVLAQAAPLASGRNTLDTPTTPAPVSLNAPSAIGTPVRIELSNNDVLTGTILDNTQGKLVLSNDVLGQVAIPFSAIVSASTLQLGPTDKPEAGPDATSDAGPDDKPSVPDTAPGPAAPQTALTPDPNPKQAPPPPAPAPKPKPQAAPKPQPKPAPQPEKPQPKQKTKPNATWNSELSFGLVGSQGNSETLNMDIGFRTKRTSVAGNFSLNARYILNNSDGRRVTNRLTTNARNDWKFKDSRWSLFIRGSAEINEFADYDVRTAFNGGMGYRWIDRPKTKLNSRMGFGGRYDFGSDPQREFAPELNLAADFNHKLSDRQKINAAAEFFPELDPIDDYRAILSSSWQYTFDTDNDLTLRLGVRWEYQSETTRAEQADLDYTARLVFGF